MNNAPRQKWPVALVVFTFAIIIAVLISEHSRTANTLNDLHREIADLRAQLDAKDQALSGLSGAPTHMRRAPLVIDQAPTSSSSALEQNLSQRLAELAVSQSNTALVLQRLARTTDSVPPEVAAQRSQAAVVVMESAVQEHMEKINAAKQKTAELLFSLNIPPEISTMESSKALDTAGLRPYWPYFEAKRERDSMESTAERLRLRLLQERVDAGIEQAK